MELTLFNMNITTKKLLKYTVLTIQTANIQRTNRAVKYYLVDEYGIQSRAEIDVTYFKNKYCVTKSYDSWHNWTDNNFLRIRRFK